MPGTFPGSPIEQDTPTAPSKRIRRTEAATPVAAAPIEAPTEEMHPKHIHQSTAKPREEARWLGFSNMPPATEPPKRNAKHVEAQATPSRTTKKQENAFKSPDFTFTFRREQSLELSPEAKQLMEEKRAEALIIKEQMRSNGEGAQISGDAFGRKIAVPKGKKSRFSELHDAQFQKMDSIAGHASAYRKDPSRLATQTPATKIAVQTPSKSLKRSPSKAELDKNEVTPTRTIPRTTSKPSLMAPPGSQLRRAPSMKNLREAATEEATPAKRVRRTESQDVSNARPSSSSSARPSSSSSDKDKALPSTPQHIKDSRAQPLYPDLAHLATPTQSSLARTGSVKSTKATSKIPGLMRSPSKPTLVEPSPVSPKPATTLMARSPVKAGIFEHPSSHPKPVTSGTGKDEHEDAMPLLSRSPTKGGLFSHTHTAVAMSGSALEEKPKSMMDAALARTPAKAGAHKHVRLDQDNSPSPQKKEPQAPLLSRSPLKKSVAKGPEAEGEQPSEKQSNIPLLSQFPSKASHSNNPFTSAVAQTPNVKSTGSNLFGHFNMLRASPIKSILRTPHRLYSDDPSKIAAGTHFSTPPEHSDTKDSKKPVPVPATAPVRKRVDFSSSTKDHDAMKMDISSEEPSSPVQEEAASAVPATITANYPALPTIFSPIVNPTPERRRQTVAPGDFTFRVGDGISFGDRLAPPASARAASSIRHVSAEPDIVPSTVAASQKKRKFDFENKMNVNPTELSPTFTSGSKKRKFTFENNVIAKTAEATASASSDKENGGGGGDEEVEVEDEESSRPAKRAKSTAVSGTASSKAAASSKSAAASKLVTKKPSRMPTLGVKPKASKAPKAGSAGPAKPAKEEKKKSTASITMARLNALAMPKRRG
jgi:hypothetical protein